MTSLIFSLRCSNDDFETTRLVTRCCCVFPCSPEAYLAVESVASDLVVRVVNFNIGACRQEILNRETIDKGGCVFQLVGCEHLVAALAVTHYWSGGASFELRFQKSATIYGGVCQNRLWKNTAVPRLETFPRHAFFTRGMAHLDHLDNSRPCRLAQRRFVLGVYRIYFGLEVQQHLVFCCGVGNNGECQSSFRHDE